MQVSGQTKHKLNKKYLKIKTCTDLHYVASPFSHGFRKSHCSGNPTFRTTNPSSYLMSKVVTVAQWSSHMQSIHCGFESHLLKQKLISNKFILHNVLFVGLVCSYIYYFVYLDAVYHELKMVSGSGLPSLTKIKKESKRQNKEIGIKAIVII